MSRVFRFLIVAAVITISSSILVPGTVRAQGIFGGQGDITSNPFSFYYAFYLPNQQLQAMRPTPMDSINAAMVTRQYYAKSDRRSLYNPISPYADSNYDPTHPYSPQGQERSARPYRFSQDPSNADGGGPSLYYNRASQYFPTLRVGRGPNGNSYASRRPSILNRRPGSVTGGMGGGMGGMGGMGGGMGGMGGMGGGMGGMGMM